MQNVIDNEIYEQISEELAKIEQTEHVRILFCAESGSRAWGFPSKDSDFDVRFIYVRDREEYLRIDAVKDFINWRLDSTFDISGWDVKKALGLLHSSNISLFEWRASQIVYRTSEEWERFAKLMDGYFSPRTESFNYYSLAKKYYNMFLLRDGVRLKKYFYVLRPIFSCLWIFENMTAPPADFNTLKAKYISGKPLEALDELLDKKLNSFEPTEISPIPVLNSYISKQLEEIATRIEAMPGKANLGWDDINEYFRSLFR